MTLYHYREWPAGEYDLADRIRVSNTVNATRFRGHQPRTLILQLGSKEEFRGDIHLWLETGMLREIDTPSILPVARDGVIDCPLFEAVDFNAIGLCIVEKLP